MKKIGVAVLTFVFGLVIGPVAVFLVWALLLIPHWPEWTAFPIYGLIVSVLAIRVLRWLGFNRYVALALLAGCSTLMVWIGDVVGIVATSAGVLLALLVTACVELRRKFTLVLASSQT